MGPAAVVLMLLQAPPSPSPAKAEPPSSISLTAGAMAPLGLEGGSATPRLALEISTPFPVGDKTPIRLQVELMLSGLPGTKAGGTDPAGASNFKAAEASLELQRRIGQHGATYRSYLILRGGAASRIAATGDTEPRQRYARYWGAGFRVERRVRSRVLGALWGILGQSEYVQDQPRGMQVMAGGETEVPLGSGSAQLVIGADVHLGAVRGQGRDLMRAWLGVRLGGIKVQEPPKPAPAPPTKPQEPPEVPGEG